MINLDTIVIVSGGFDPIHSGHIELFKNAKKAGDKVIVLLNSDSWLIRKKGKFFMDWVCREIILSSISYIDEVHTVDDRTDTVIAGLRKIREKYKDNRIIFANGGNRKSDTTPEVSVCIELEMEMHWNMDMGTTMSSSALLIKFSQIKETRGWGYYSILAQGDRYKVKELFIKPFCGISLQKHMFRSEHWTIVSGVAAVLNDNKTSIVRENESVFIPVGNIHRLRNNTNCPIKVIETQVGSYLEEDDIIRLSS